MYLHTFYLRTYYRHTFYLCTFYLRTFYLCTFYLHTFYLPTFYLPTFCTFYLRTLYLCTFYLHTYLGICLSIIAVPIWSFPDKTLCWSLQVPDVAKLRPGPLEMHRSGLNHYMDQISTPPPKNYHILNCFKNMEILFSIQGKKCRFSEYFIID